MEFITKSDFEKINKYAGLEKDSIKDSELRNVYDKLWHVCELLKRKGYGVDINRKLCSQGSKFKRYQNYQWAKVFPEGFKKHCSGKFSYVIGLSENLHFHMRGLKEYEDKEASLRASNSSWRIIEIDKSNYEILINDFIEFDKNNRTLFIKTGAELEIDYCKTLINEIQFMKNLELLKSNKNIVLTGAPGTGKTYLAKKIAEEMTGSKADEVNVQYSFVQFHPSYDYTDFVEGLRPKKEKDINELGFELKNGIFKEFCKKAKGKPEKDFVFIIDEINRAEISKVFGELFFAIDPGYRGEEGKVKTQYANMQTDETFFTDKDDDYFFVPSNVYIIATMNDIDRSVESFDFAMRRRFAWVEINANERIEMWNGNDWKDKAKYKMTALNNAIYNKNENKGMDGLNSSYHIGPAYFLKLNNYPEDTEEDKFNKLWKNHLEVLLREYLRGMPKAEGKLEELKDAYDLKKS